MEVYGEKWNTSDKNWKEAFWETALCSLSSSLRVTAFPSRSRSLRLFLCNLQRDIWKPNEDYGGKENILRWKLERSFMRNCFVMCDFHSLSYSCISWNCLLALFLWILRTDISDFFEDYRTKRNVLQSKWERSFLRNCLVICEFISQSYNFPLRSLSVRLFWNFKGTYGSPRKAVVKREIYSDKNRSEAFWETALCSVNTSPRIRAFPSRSVSLRLLLWNWQRDIWKPLEGYGEKGNILR